MNTPVRVKICGITNRDDALAAMDAGADALGFNLFPGSKRHVRAEELAPWLGTLGGGAMRVAVMVNPTIEEIRSVQPMFDAVQLHGQETPGLCAAAAAGGVVWKAFPLTASLDAAAVAPFEANAVLIDSSVPGAFGGTGVLIDVELAARFIRGCDGRQVWLSGGLNPQNVADAIQKSGPYGVDVAGGVEVAGNPRKKDLERVRAFIAAARGASGAA